MLCLSRREGEEIYLDIPPSTVPVRVEVRVGRFNRAKSRFVLLFNAPKEVLIRRKEVVHAEKKQ
jgi:sRNA-binding carbon storage regulator CsrA